MLAHDLEKLSVYIPSRQFLSAVSEILKDCTVDALAGVGIWYFYLWSKFPSAVLKHFRSGADDAFLPNCKILAPYLGTKEVQPDVADDFVECPTAAICALKVISKGNIAVWISGFSLSQELAIWRVLGEEGAVNVFTALTVVALFGEPIDRNVVEVLRRHYADSK